MTSRAPKSREIQISSLRRFGSTMGKQPFLLLQTLLDLFLSLKCFLSTLLHQGGLSRKRSSEKELDLIEKTL
jgi:hypothetical protein